MPLCLFADSQRDLGDCYNQDRDEAPSGAARAFVHDDVSFDARMAGARLQEVLVRSEVLGVTGNTRRHFGQPTWYLRPGSLVNGVHGLRFDPAFGFHFHDRDFCRVVLKAGLSLDTWPIAITHASAGHSGQTAQWHQAGTIYQAKYGER